MSGKGDTRRPEDAEAVRRNWPFAERVEIARPYGIVEEPTITLRYVHASLPMRPGCTWPDCSCFAPQGAGVCRREA